MNEILNLKNVSLAYQTDTDEIRALDSVSFGVGNGEFVAFPAHSFHQNGQMHLTTASHIERVGACLGDVQRNVF